LHALITHYIPSAFILVPSGSSDKTLPILEPAPQLLLLDISYQLRRAVGLAMEPEYIWSINTSYTRQQIEVVLISFDVGEQHIPVHFPQQAVFPRQTGG
jgi:hypothetical protein